MTTLPKIPNAVIFNTLRILKKHNPGDLYYEAYLGHLAKRKETFFDIYHFSWAWAIEHKPKRILEIGVRTGLSICQLLSAYIDNSIIEKVVLCDVFNDGYTSPELVKMNLKALNIPIDKIEFLIGDSKELIPQLQEKFDYILIDGSHDPQDALTDLENVSSLVNQGGVIVFDDITPDGMNLLPVWNDFKSKHEAEFEWHSDENGKGLGWAIKL